MSTQVTVQLMKEYLERFGWHRYRVVDEPIEREGLIQTGWRSGAEGEGYGLVIDPMVEKNCLAFRSPQLLKAPRDETPAERLTDLLIAMGAVNYSIILGKFSYDPRDGEVNFAINVPIDENTFTYEQFEHCLRVVALSVDKYTPIFKAIVAGTKPLEEFLKEEMGEAEGLIRTLREFLEMLERSVGEGSKREEEEPLEEV